MHEYSNCTVELSPSEGVLPAYLQSDVRLTLRPSQCLLYTSTLSYELITNKRIISPPPPPPNFYHH